MDMVKQGYKQTEIGVIPEDWEMFTIRDLITLLTDYDANGSFSSVAENVKSYNYPEYAWYVRSTDLENNTDLSNVKYVDKASYSFLKKTSLFGGELLFLKRGDIGNVYLFEMKTKRATLAPNLYLLKLNDISSSKYLYQYFISETGQKQLKRKNAGSTLGALYKDDVKSILIPLPPLAEQQAIATALSDADAWIESLEQLIAKKRLIKQGAMQELLTPKEDWEVKKLGEVLSHRPDYGINAPAVEFSSSLPTYIRITDIGRDGTFMNGNKVSVDSLLSEMYVLQDGDICVARTGASVGKSYFHSFLDGQYVFAGFLIRLRVDSKVLYSRFLFYLTKSKNYDNFIISNSMRSGQPGINSNELEAFIIPFPPLLEQTRIATILSDMDTELEALDNQLAKARQIKQGMMQELLTGRVRLV
ncbi:type I restriction enzyme, S subunit [Myroides marinus]|uniref:Type I restriction enzyme, S subunit n=2 Tax=Flavobacteriaceae TaxID=49546 RepID=A0A1H6W750_9FLAO|nr:type I restriction enzyme, S subunit [Myroides marinus]